MKKTFFNLIMLFALAVQGQKGIKFITNSTLEELKSKAKKENKFIFIDVYTTWCGPCQFLSKEVFTDAKVGAYYNEHFINAKFDAEDEKEGTKIAELFNVQCYPNLLFINSDGKLVHRFAGASGTIDEFVDLGKTAFDPNMCFEAIESNYRKNPNDKLKALAYIKVASKTCIDFQEDLDQYLKGVDFLAEENWTLIYENIENFDHPITQYIIKNLNAFKEKYPEQIAEFLLTNIDYKARDLLYTDSIDNETFQEFLNSVKSIDLIELSEIVFYLEIEQFKLQENWAGFIAYLKDKKPELDDQMILNLSFEIAENIQDEACVTLAHSWMKELCDASNGKTWQNQYVMAKLLNRQGKTKEALVFAESSLKLSDENEEAISMIEALIEELKEIKD